MARKKKLVPVTERAIIGRINRRLNKEYLRLCKARTWTSDTGDFYILDFNHNTIAQSHIDLEQYGREIGALAAWEEVRNED